MSFESGGHRSNGLLIDGAVHPLDPVAFPQISDVIKALMGGTLPAARAPAELPESAIHFLPPLAPASKVLCVGVNYLPHIREMGREPPDYPVVFTRFANSIVGHGEALVAPAVSEQYDFEGELAVVIGKRCHRVPAAEAQAVIAGYCPFMDGSVRDYQRHTGQFTPGKNFWRSGAAGPAIVTADEAGDVRDLVLTTRLDGEIMQQASISDLLFDIPGLVEYCSGFAVLEPGDMIVTGTPGGVGAARKPPVWLRPGHRLEVDLGPVGCLENPVIAETDV